MSSSLQEQLLKAGLATKQGVRNAQADKRKRNKQKQKKGTVQTSELTEQVEQAKVEKQQKDLELNQQLKAEAVAKAEKARVKQMIEQHGLTAYNGDLVFNFTYQGKVKKLYVDEKARSALIDGRLGICVLADEFYLLVDDTVRKLQSIDAEVVAYLFDRSQQSTQQTVAEDDPYAEYQIPDDLMW